MQGEIDRLWEHLIATVGLNQPLQKLGKMQAWLVRKCREGLSKAYHRLQVESSCAERHKYVSGGKIKQIKWPGHKIRTGERRAETDSTAIMWR